ncbi:hypothetical protein CMUS01_14039 [Colletotrichum musicola]|uniref:Uncharacterized protein n=1 Tax=Colletotrichum musicola TaxID=2175873 RepID=A0A8H6J774_9PEZI|nr:hypothetical protein CMUS01_14039 [Colletotrichum musicola]
MTSNHWMVTGQACRERWDGENVGGGVEWMDAGGRSEDDKDEDEDEELDAGPTELTSGSNPTGQQDLACEAFPMKGPAGGAPNTYHSGNVGGRGVGEVGRDRAWLAARTAKHKVEIDSGLVLGEVVWCLAVALGLIGIHQETAVTIAGLFQEVLATSMLFLAL